MDIATSPAPPAAPAAAAAAAATDARTNLVGLSREELAAELATIGAPKFRANQLWHWIYHRGVAEFDAMTTLSKAFRADLA